MPEPTAYDQFLLELINKARANPTAEASRLGINLNQGLNAGQISTAPKQPLAFNGDLVDAAHKHSKWMLDTDTFSHTGSGGSSFTTRMKAEGYVFSGSWTAGENISWGGSTGTINQLAHTLAPALTEEVMARGLRRYFRRAAPSPYTHGSLFRPVPQGTGASGGYRQQTSGSQSLMLAGLAAAGVIAAGVFAARR